MKKKEKKAKKAKRFIKFSPIIIFIVGLVAGGLLIGFGIAHNFNEEYDVLKTKNEETLKEDVKNKVEEVKKLREEQNAEYEKSSTSEEYQEIHHRVVTAEGELSDLEADLYDTQSGVYRKMRDDKINISLLMISIGIIVMMLGAGITIKLNNRKKDGKILTVNEE